MNETVHQETTPVANKQQTERTFTQVEVNTIITDRLNRERAKYADYDAIKTKAQQFDAAQEANKTELQKANERVASLQAQVDSLTKANTLRELRVKISAETGVPSDLLTGDTEEACKAQAAAIVKFAKPSGYPVVRDGGEPRHIPTAPDVAARAFDRNQKHTPKPY